LKRSNSGIEQVQVVYVRPRRPILKLKESAEAATTLSEQPVPSKVTAFFNLLSPREKALHMRAARRPETAPAAKSAAPPSSGASPALAAFNPPSEPSRSSPVAGWAAQYGFDKHMKEVSGDLAELYGEDPVPSADLPVADVATTPYPITETPQAMHLFPEISRQQPVPNSAAPEQPDAGMPVIASGEPAGTMLSTCVSAEISADPIEAIPVTGSDGSEIPASKAVATQVPEDATSEPSSDLSSSEEAEMLIAPDAEIGKTSLERAGDAVGVTLPETASSSHPTVSHPVAEPAHAGIDQAAAKPAKTTRRSNKATRAAAGKAAKPHKSTRRKSARPSKSSIENAQSELSFLDQLSQDPATSGRATAAQSAELVAGSLPAEIPVEAEPDDPTPSATFAEAVPEPILEADGGASPLSREVLEMLSLIRDVEKSRDEAWRTLIADRSAGNDALIKRTVFLQRCVKQLIPEHEVSVRRVEVRNPSFGKTDRTGSDPHPSLENRSGRGPEGAAPNLKAAARPSAGRRIAGLCAA
jgi:hypothetical protein